MPSESSTSRCAKSSNRSPVAFSMASAPMAGPMLEYDMRVPGRQRAMREVVLN